MFQDYRREELASPGVFPITRGGLTLRLPRQLDVSDFFCSRPFTIFSNGEVLPNTDFDEFSRQVGRFMQDRLPSTGVTGKRKYKIGPGQLRLSRASGLVKDFCDALFSRNFEEWFVNTHGPYFFRDPSRVVFVRGWLERRLFIAVNKLFRLIFRHKLFSILEVSIQFSDIDPGGFIPPHTDNFTKRLALVLYVPDQAVTEEMRNEWGTVFWESRAPADDSTAWESSHQEGDNLARFLRKYSRAVKVPYEANRIVGFIKGPRSWHSVDTNQLKVPRRAIVINIHELSADESDVPSMDELQLGALPSDSS